MPYRILIVEDNFYISDMYKKVFEKNGHEVVVAYDGKKALALADKTFDIILLDIMLPEHTGVELVKEWRKATSSIKDVPILIISNLDQSDVINGMFKDGADGYILKSELTPTEIVDETINFLVSRSDKKK